MTQEKWPYDLPIYRRAFRLASPDGRHVARIDPALEVSMSNPTIGQLRLSAGLQVEGCNPAFLWSSDSRFLAVPRYVYRAGLFRRQRMLIIDLPGRAAFASRESARYFQPESFSGGRLVAVIDPFSSPREIAWLLPEDLERRFRRAAIVWTEPFGV